MQGTLFRILKPAQQVEQMKQWADQYGSTFPIFMRNMIKNGGLTMQDTFLIGMSPSDPNLPFVAEAIATPMKDLKNSFNKDDLEDLQANINAGSSTFDDFSKSFEAYPSLQTPKYLSNLRTFISKYAMDRDWETL